MNVLIAYLLIFLVEAVALYIYTNHLFQAKAPLHQRLAALILLYFILLMASQAGIALLNICLFTLVNFIYIYVFFDISIIHAVFHVLFLSVINSLCELFILAAIPRIASGISLEGITEPQTLMYMMLTKLAYLMILCSIAHRFKDGNYFISTNRLTTVLLIFISVSVFGVMLVFILIYESISSNEFLTRFIFLISIGLILAVISVYLLYDYIGRRDAAYTQMRLTMQREKDLQLYHTALVEQIEGQKTMIHDIKNHVTSVQLLLKQENYDEAKSYLDSLTESPSLQTSPEVCDNQLLNSILLSYRQKCDLMNISLFTDIRLKTTDFLDNIDLTTLFCNLLDNAVEAATNSEDAYIDLIITGKTIPSSSIINIVNSCHAKPYMDSQNTFLTTKNNPLRHGIGLKSIRKVVEKYDGDMTMSYDEEERAFHTKILLHRPEIDQNA